jgi:hypothetical protein
MAHIRPYRGKWRAEVERNGQRVSKLVETEEDARLWAKYAVAALDAQASRYRPSDRLTVAGPELVTLVPKTVLDACREIPHTQHVVMAAAIPMSKASGIYFLFRAGSVVYVGQSVDVLHRIARHRREGKAFDAFAYMECDPSELDRLETLYIKAFVPEENLTFGNHRGQKPLLGTRRKEPQSEAKAGSSESMLEPRQGSQPA